MNETLKKFMEAMLNLLKEAKDFTLAQAPDIFKQIIAREIAVDVMWIVVFSLLIILFFSLSIKMLNCAKKASTSCDSEGYTFGCGFFSVASFVCLIPLVINVKDLICVLVAPKIFLIEYFTELLKK